MGCPCCRSPLVVDGVMMDLASDTPLPGLACRGCEWGYPPQALVGENPLADRDAVGACPSHRDGRRPHVSSYNVRTTYVYVARLSEGARGKVLGSMRADHRSWVDPGLPCIYVGFSENRPKRRWEIHREGGKTSASIVHEHGVELMPGLFEYLNGWGKRPLNEGLTCEKWLAEHLRRQGYAVHGQSHGTHPWPREDR